MVAAEMTTVNVRRVLNRLANDTDPRFPLPQCRVHVWEWDKSLRAWECERCERAFTRELVVNHPDY